MHSRKGGLLTKAKNIGLKSWQHIRHSHSKYNLGRNDTPDKFIWIKRGRYAKQINLN
jgi:hypothetical protein